MYHFPPLRCYDCTRYSNMPVLPNNITPGTYILTNTSTLQHSLTSVLAAFSPNSARVLFHTNLKTLCPSSALILFNTSPYLLFAQVGLLVLFDIVFINSFIPLPCSSRLSYYPSQLLYLPKVPHFPTAQYFYTSVYSSNTKVLSHTLHPIFCRPIPQSYPRPLPHSCTISVCPSSAPFLSNIISLNFLMPQ